jgi:hypothetical protein
LQLQGACFVPDKSQIRGGFRMMWVECQGTFVVQDGFTEIGETKPGVA